MLEMLQMGKYGVYVWSCYGLAVVVMGYVAIKPIIDKKAMLNELMMKYRRDSREHLNQQQANKEHNSV